MKKILAIILALVTIVTTVPFMAFAQSAKNAEENGQMTTETTATGNNSVGTYLAETFQEAQAENKANASDLAGMSYLSFDGNTATVEFATQVDAQLIVAIYSEDGTKMLASGMKDVTTEDRNVTVDITSTTLPEYYLVKAFLLDKNNNSALCGEFIDDTHTKAYHDFEALDIYDFDADKVINLDSNPDNNFLVVADDAFEIFGDETTNTLVSADYDTGIYEFDNIADDIKSLKVGDVFYYQSDENYEVIKVKSIDINGSEATIVADSMDIEEAFEVIKINSSEFEDNTATYSRSVKAASTEETVEDEFVNGTFTVKLGEDEKGKIRPIISKDFAIGEEEHPEDYDEKDYNDSDFKFVAEATGSAKMTAKLVVYIKDDYKKVEFTVTGSIGLEVKVGMEFDEEILLGDFFFTFYKIVTIGVEIKFHFKISVILTISGTIEFVKGFKWTTATGKFTDVSKPCEFKPEVKIEGEIYIGLILAPYVNVISKNVVYVNFPIEVGADVKAVLSTDVAGDENHSCDACLDGDIEVKVEAQATVRIARNINWLEKTYSSPKFGKTYHIWDFYYSITYSEFGWGECPYSRNITDSGKCGENMNWSIDEEDGILYITGDGYMTDYNTEASPWSEYKNIKTVYIDEEVLSIGDNAFEKCDKIEIVYFYGTETQWKQVKIGKNNKYLTEAFIQYMDDSDKYDASGKCGDNLIWTFDEDTRTLTISGKGAMYDYSYNNYPWINCNSIKKVIINHNVTTIGACAFYRCASLTSVTIPSSVTTIGACAFYWCISLTSVTIPDSVTTIGNSAFNYCLDLTNVTIGDNVITIGKNAFEDCDSLTSVTIPDSVTSFGGSAFYDCDSLTSVTIGDSVTAIGNSAFADCSNLTSVTIGDSVTTIGEHAFFWCSSLTEVTIPDSVTSIGNYAFSNCNNLAEVYYSGTEEQWNVISIGLYNEDLTNATNHYNSTGVTYSLRSNQVDLLSFSSTNSTETDVYTAIAQNTVVNNKYIILVLKNSADINNFTDEDILYIDQKTGEAEDITFNFVPKTDDECIVYIIGLFADSDSVKQEIITPEEVECKHSSTETIKGYAPTCTTTGLTDGVKCSECGEILTSQQEIPATGHADNDGDGYCDADNELLDPTVECGCNCHKSGISNFFFKFALFFQKLFGANKTCDCGVAHY